MVTFLSTFVIAHVFWNMYCHCILVHLAWGQSPWHSPPKVGYKPIHRNCTWHMFCANDTCSTLSHQRFLGTKICAAVVCSVVMMWLSATYEFIISYIYIYNMYCMFIYTYAYVCVCDCVCTFYVSRYSSVYGIVNVAPIHVNVFRVACWAHSHCAI